MKSHTHSPGTDATAAHRRELDQEPQTREERPTRAITGKEAVFRDLRQRNERRARLTQVRRKTP
jgi:hypothetical protein